MAKRLMKHRSGGHGESGCGYGEFFKMAEGFSKKQKKIKRKGHLKIERFLEDYRALKPARYSYANVKKITNQFKDKVGQGGYGTVYKGQLSNDVYVAVKILSNIKDNGEEFINEVGIIGTIHHVNVVRLVGYCADGFRKALIYKFLPNDSLEKFASSYHKKLSLGWQKLLEIAMGIAKGIEYLHQGKVVFKPPNPFASINPTLATGQASGRPFKSELEIIVESE
ncbi:hypothetical protein RHSIM_Rhsim03G0206200 [Rhododendron simsii]|uniref:Protein kinase domain-containing protein n=1 Tax=Rhododendron simsii TaxID=118357 RepID=A0A834LQV0_RHOSS|nr:hypothetical protein RHSIM_Rhsim03G0206200 [Rhododendron simsii]